MKELLQIKEEHSMCNEKDKQHQEQMADHSEACRANIETLLRRKGMTHENSQDLAQDVILRFHTSYAAKPKIKSLFRGQICRYLFVMASTMLINHNRPQKNKELTGIIGHTESEDRDILERLSQGMMSAEFPHPEDIIEKSDLQEKQDKLYAALNHLSQSQRTAIILHHLQGHSLDEVAGIMNSTPQAVKQSVYNGRKNLAKLLTKDN